MKLVNILNGLRILPNADIWVCLAGLNADGPNPVTVWPERKPFGWATGGLESKVISCAGGDAIGAVGRGSGVV